MLIAIRDDDGVGLGTSIELFENLVSRHPAPLPEYHLDLGDAYFRLSDGNSELRDKAQRNWRQYLEIAEAGDGERRRVEQQLRSLEESGP